MQAGADDGACAGAVVLVRGLWRAGEGQLQTLLRLQPGSEE